MVLSIVPKQGIGPIQLGMTVGEIRRLLGDDFHEFMRTQSSRWPTDHFGELGIFVEYKEFGVCCAIEVTSPAQPLLNGEELLDRPYNVIEELLRSFDPNLLFDDSGAASLALGVGIYASSMCFDRTAPVESVIVFENGYYDELIRSGLMK